MSLRRENDSSFYCAFGECNVSIGPTQPQLKDLCSGKTVTIRCPHSRKPIKLEAVGSTFSTLDYSLTCTECGNNSVFTANVPPHLQSVVSDDIWCLKEEVPLHARISGSEALLLGKKWRSGKNIECPFSGRVMRIRRVEDLICGRESYEFHCTRCGAHPSFPDDRTGYEDEEDSVW